MAPLLTTESPTAQTTATHRQSSLNHWNRLGEEREDNKRSGAVAEGDAERRGDAAEGQIHNFRSEREEI